MIGGVKPTSEPHVFSAGELSNEKGNCTHSTVGSSDANGSCTGLDMVLRAEGKPKSAYTDLHSRTSRLSNC